MVIKTANEIYTLCKNISLILPENYANNVKKNFSLLGDHFNNLTGEKTVEQISEEDIIQNLKNVKDLTLELTQNCNLRCKYCTYSGLYKSRRPHQPQIITHQTAQKAIKFFFNYIDSPLRTRKDFVNISFFGGEPVLEIESLLNSIKYAKEINNGKHKLRFLMTTNGLLLTEEIIAELIKENFFIDFSIDGPEEEHDLFRVTASGNGSFKNAWKNILFIRDKFPEYFKNKVRFFITLHPLHDIQKIENFFLSNDHIFNEKNVLLNRVNINKYLRKDERSLWEKARKDQYKKSSVLLHKDKWFYKKKFLNK